MGSNPTPSAIPMVIRLGIVKMVMVRAIKGTKDILPGEVSRWHLIESAARETFGNFGYEEIRTPMFEETELFIRGIGEATDVVAKEMYTFSDRSGNSLTLRPEMTAPVVRACIEHHLEHDRTPLRLYYMGPMFRYERPQKGRFRQFHQIGAEVIGSDHPAIEAEAIEMLLLMLERLQINGSELDVNSIGCSQCRPAYLDLLRSQVFSRLENFCIDCRDRATRNVLRVLDCKQESCQLEIDCLAVISDHLCWECRNHFQDFRAWLDKKDIRFRHRPRLVRGLDYYEKTTFEITSPLLGAQNALAGGGRYDGLSVMLGGKPFKGFGFAMGLERLVLALPEKMAQECSHPPEIHILPLSPEAVEKASLTASKFRRMGVKCLLDYQDRSIKSGLRSADRSGAHWALILGEDELRTGLWQLKDLKGQGQRAISEGELFQMFATGKT